MLSFLFHLFLWHLNIGVYLWLSFLGCIVIWKKRKTLCRPNQLATLYSWVKSMQNSIGCFNLCMHNSHVQQTGMQSVFNLDISWGGIFPPKKFQIPPQRFLPTIVPPDPIADIPPKHLDFSPNTEESRLNTEYNKIFCQCVVINIII